MTTFPTTYSGLIVRKGIPFSTLCPHHTLVYQGKAHFAYLPNEKKLGLSKISRLIQHHSRVLMPQEELTDFVLKKLVEPVNPRGAMLIQTAYHTCESCRGVKVTAPTTTSSLYGEFLDDPDLKDEVIGLLTLMGGTNGEK